MMVKKESWVNKNLKHFIKHLLLLLNAPETDDLCVGRELTPASKILKLLHLNKSII